MNRIKLAENIIKTAYLNKEGHIASAFSILEIIDFLYTKKIKKEDDFILSKGHGSLALYAVLLKHNYISEEDFFSFCQENSKLGGHPSSKKIPQIKLSTGSLGHGLAFSTGLALSKKIKNENGTIYCLIGDGEANEGSVWEAALIASSYQLDNLYCIMDFNKSGERAIKLESCIEKFESFNWDSCLIQDGNNQEEIEKTFNKKENQQNKKPKFIQLNTVKGKGCPSMENNPEWHHKQPATEEEMNELIKTLY